MENYFSNDLGPIFDSDGNYNPEKAQQEYLQKEQQKLVELQRHQESLEREVFNDLGPIFDSDGNYNPEKAQQEYLQREQQELLASQIVEQMANENIEFELPGNVLK